MPSRTLRYLKVALETELLSKCVVVATSSGATRLDGALFQRFRIDSFWSGRQLAEACSERLRAIWRAESDGLPVPSELDC